MKKFIVSISFLCIVIFITSCNDTSPHSIGDEHNDQNLSLINGTEAVGAIEYHELSNNERVIYGEENHDAPHVSIIRLIATPERYHGEIIRVVGIGNIEFEGNSIYLSREAWQMHFAKEAVWLSFHDEQRLILSDLARANGRKVIVEGTFNQYFNGHRGGFSGSIENITRYEEHWFNFVGRE